MSIFPPLMVRRRQPGDCRATSQLELCFLMKRAAQIFMPHAVTVTDEVLDEHACMLKKKKHLNSLFLFPNYPPICPICNTLISFLFLCLDNMGEVIFYVTVLGFFSSYLHQKEKGKKKGKPLRVLRALSPPPCSISWSHLSARCLSHAEIILVWEKVIAKEGKILGGWGTAMRMKCEADGDIGIRRQSVK